MCSSQSKTRRRRPSSVCTSPEHVAHICWASMSYYHNPRGWANERRLRVMGVLRVLVRCAPSYNTRPTSAELHLERHIIIWACSFTHRACSPPTLEWLIGMPIAHTSTHRVERAGSDSVFNVGEALIMCEHYCNHIQIVYMCVLT